MSAPGQRSAMALVLFVFLLLVTVGVALQGWDIHLGLVLTEIGLIGLPTVLACWFGRHRLAPALGLVRPAGGRLAFSLRFAAALGPLASLTVLALTLPLLLVLVLLGGTYPGVGLPLSGPGDLAWALLSATLLAPVCEELLFRGFLLRAFRPVGVHAAVVLAAVCFGIFHMDPIRFLPTALLGLVFGYLAAWSGSVYPAMVAHVVHNGGVLLSAYFLGDGQAAAGVGLSYESMRGEILHALEGSGVALGAVEPDTMVRLALGFLAVSSLVVGSLLATALVLALRWFAGQVADTSRAATPLPEGDARAPADAVGPTRTADAPPPQKLIVAPGLFSALVKNPSAWALAVGTLLVWVRLVAMYFPD